jgi:two-component sensor histidine kinase
VLISKDATIRRSTTAKNNLQTIAALLRLQGRHLQSPEGAALEESERRIRDRGGARDLVARPRRRPLRRHPTLVRSCRRPSVARRRPALDVVGDAVTPGDPPRRFAVVLNELMQNAVDHAFPFVEDDRVAACGCTGAPRASCSSTGRRRRGLASTFSIGAERLGPSIVQALVRPS